ncbi:hypothetical protein [Flavobacterium caeni]|uniref:Acetyltransferase (GNAT) domain-containing protein n=1 Tax=Flavobacterium caeni TaxID=490189 RepID=A0A1G5AZT6_9FLAO|nr:hypothetical protein [Flavobacterium caeni]SCX83407.1 hypothetical protein SAMN02927903_00206 [Flavobacterium caeni]
MKNYTVQPYEPQYYDLWNAFVCKAKNATFLFERDFMEYHSHRFEDCSLLVFDNQKLMAVMPANRVGDEVFSHQGLTYGGLVLPPGATPSIVFDLFDAVLRHLKSKGFRRIEIKPILSFYHQEPAFESDCFLVAHGAKLYRRDCNLAVDFNGPDLLSKSKKKHYRRVSSAGIEIVESRDFGPFWKEVLGPKLASKYGAKPVHSLDEITLLAKRFPHNITQYDAYYDGRIVAGITLFEFENGIKSQYGATTIEGEKWRALDFLFITLIDKFKERMAFFDMGTVMATDGQINTGLMKQKEELGCSVYHQDFYSLAL